MKSLSAKGPAQLPVNEASGRVSGAEGWVEEIHLAGQSKGQRGRKRLCKTETSLQIRTCAQQRSWETPGGKAEEAKDQEKGGHRVLCFPRHRRRRAGPSPAGRPAHPSTSIQNRLSKWRPLKLWSSGAPRDSCPFRLDGQTEPGRREPRVGPGLPSTHSTAPCVEPRAPATGSITRPVNVELNLRPRTSNV